MDITDIVSGYSNNCTTELQSKLSTFIRENPILNKEISPPAGHEKNQKFECKFCKKSFRLNHSLNIHINKKHATDTKKVDQKLCLKLQKFQGVWHSRFVPKKLNVGLDYGTDRKYQVCNENVPLDLTLNDHVVHCKMSTPAKSNMSMKIRCNDHTNASSKYSICKQELPKKRLGSENTSEVGLNLSLPKCDASSSIMAKPKAIANNEKKLVKHYSCSTCKDTFPSMRNLIAHQSLHIIARPCICRFCDRRFSNNRYRKSHENVHDININTFDSNDNVFQQKNENQSGDLLHQNSYCSLCEKQYTYHGSFRKHVLKMHFQRTTFNNDNAQINPVDIVENITNIKLECSDDFLQGKCDCCDTTFGAIPQLKLHLSFNKRCINYYRHVQPDIFGSWLSSNQCTICNKIFKTFHNCKRHIIVIHAILERDYL